MCIAVGSDHAGFELRATLAKSLADAGHQVIDLGTGSSDPPVDDPEFGSAVGRSVTEGRADRGMCVCGTGTGTGIGIGIGIAASEVSWVRAATVHDVTTATLALHHNDANVICIGGRTTGTADAVDAVHTFFSTESEARHERRLDEIAEFERQVSRR